MPNVTACADAIGFDCSAKLSISSAKALAAMGFHFAVRYVGLTQPNIQDIDVGERDVILGEIGALWIVQHVLNPGWSPSSQLGQLHGVSAARNALAAGYMPGATIWQDLEGVSSSSTSDAVVEYTNAWGDAVLAAGFDHGLYIGFDTILTSSELYHSLATVRTYWSDFGDRSVAIRGFAVKQLTNSIVLPAVSFPIDVDVCHEDMIGGRPKWMVA